MTGETNAEEAVPLSEPSSANPPIPSQIPDPTLVRKTDRITALQDGVG